jgi:hypothetical protein
LVVDAEEGTLQGYIVDGFHRPLWSKTKKPLAIALSQMRMGLRVIYPMYNISLIGTVTMNPPV